MPKNQKPKYKCPKCGNIEEKLISKQHEGDESNTFLMCNKCGHRALQKAFMPSPQITVAQSKDVGNDQNKKAPSNKPEAKDDPVIKNPRDLHKRFRKREEKRIMSRDPENVRNVGTQTARREIMDNPFVKKAKVSKESKEINPFVKEAREFRWTDTQKERKKDKNMVFPESKQEEGSDETSVGGGKGSGSFEQQETRFDTIDRKEVRNSPDPQDLLPGYKEWYNKEVDEYYDGWLDNHIENSGGKIVGSNTEKVMNLEDGERAHAPEYPTEAAYEKLLESRHELGDDKKEMVASANPFIKQANKKVVAEVNPFVKKKPSLKRTAFPVPMHYEPTEEDMEMARLAIERRYDFVNDIRNMSNELETTEFIKEVAKYMKHEQIVVSPEENKPWNIESDDLNTKSFGAKNPFCKGILKTAAWEISMSPEGWNNVYENLHGMSVEELAEAIASDDFAKINDEKDPLGGDISFLETKEEYYLKLPQDVLADEAYKRIEENNTSDNGGHMVWIDKEGFHKVPVDNMSEMIEEDKEDQKSSSSQLNNQECGGSMFCDDSKISGTRAPFCPNKEHKGEKIRLIKNSPENKYFMCPSCKKVYYNKGNSIGEKQPEWEKIK